MPFPFEKLTAYQQAVRFCELAEKIRKATRGKVSRSLLDQLSRAALSIPLNLAEGNGRWHEADKKQFYWIARGSAYECVPVLEILYKTGAVDSQCYGTGYAILEEVARTISGMIKVRKF